MKKALKPSNEMADDPALALGNTVVTALAGNSHIPTPDPSIATIQTGVDNYTSSLGKAKNGSREDKAQKNADKAVLITLLRNYCDYVNLLAKGDEVILASCGLPLSKDRQPRVLGTPEAKAELGASGQMLLFTPGVSGAVTYKHKYKPDVEGAAWIEIISTKASCLLTGLTPGTVYLMQIEAFGTKNQVTASNIISKMAV